MSLRNWVTLIESFNNYQTEIYGNKKFAGEHIRGYNWPPSSEMAAVIRRAVEGIVGRQNIVVRRRGQTDTNGNEVFDTISTTHLSYYPLCYNILAPYGRDGWHMARRCQTTLPKQVKEEKSPSMFYTYQLFQLPGQFNLILTGVRVFQQCAVDQYSKVESERLRYVRRSRQTFRAAGLTALPKLLADYGNTENQAQAVRVGLLFR